MLWSRQTGSSHLCTVNGFKGRESPCGMIKMFTLCERDWQNVTMSKNKTQNEYT